MQLIKFILVVAFLLVLAKCTPSDKSSASSMQNAKSRKAEANQIEKGKEIFKVDCASCHPSLIKNGKYEISFETVLERLPEPSELYFATYIRNSRKLKLDGNEYAKKLDSEFQTEYEHLFNMTDEEISSLIVFIKSKNK